MLSVTVFLHFAVSCNKNTSTVSLLKSTLRVSYVVYCFQGPIGIPGRPGVKVSFG